MTALVLVPAAAVYLSMRQEKIYQASAQDYVSDTNLGSGLTGVNFSTVFQPPERILQTEADLAGSPPVARRVAAKLNIRSRPWQVILAESSVYPKPDSNILVFTTNDPVPAYAVRIVNAFANEYTVFRRDLDAAGVDASLRSVRRQMNDLEGRGQMNSELYLKLQSSAQTLETLKTLGTATTYPIKPAAYAAQVQPKPVRNGVLGLILGIVLGLGFAALREALDTRVRSAEEVGERLGLPLLARVPEPPRRLRRDNRLVMIAQPNGIEAEAFRMLRTNLDFVRLGREVRTIMVTSAVEAEGKSTTAANLAIALARTGQRVVLVDLDLRRPFLHRFFGLDGPGLTQVALGYASLPQALAPIPVVADQEMDYSVAHENGNGNGNGGGGGRLEGMLEVLPSGPIPPNVDNFIGTQAVADILRLLRARSDVVIVDSTPLLVVGDAMALTAAVDGVVVVARNNVVRRPMLRELRRVLDASPVEKLGFVLTGVGSEEGGYEGYSYYYRGYTTPAKEQVS